MGKKSFSPKQSFLRKLEMLATFGLFIALLVTGRSVAKAASVAVMPSTPESTIAGKQDASLELTQKLKKMSAVAQQSKLTVIEFGSKSCEPCQQLQETFAAAKERFGEQVEFVQVDIDDPSTEQLQDKYQVGSIPAVFYLDKNGTVVHQTVGYGGKDWFFTQLSQFTNRVIANNPD